MPVVSDLYLKTGWPVQLRGCYPEGPCVRITNNYNSNKNKNMCMEIFTIIINYEL